MPVCQAPGAIEIERVREIDRMEDRDGLYSQSG
jgi:hypothetical protein